MVRTAKTRERRLDYYARQLDRENIGAATHCADTCTRDSRLRRNLENALRRRAGDDNPSLRFSEEYASIWNVAERRKIYLCSTLALQIRRAAFSERDCQSAVTAIVRRADRSGA